MTADEFLKTKHFNYFGFVSPLDLKKGGRYTYVTRVYKEDEDRYYDIVCDDNMNFYYCLSFIDGLVIEI